jgi:hypothetical protein
MKVKKVQKPEAWLKCKGVSNMGATSIHYSNIMRIYIYTRALNIIIVNIRRGADSLFKHVSSYLQIKKILL